MATSEIHIGHATSIPNPPRSGRESILSMTPLALSIFPARDIAHETFGLISNGVTSSRFMSLLSRTQADLRATSVPILVDRHRARRHVVLRSDLKRPKRRWLGQLALELYFTQLFRSDSAILDLSPARLGVADSGDAVWSPLPLYIRWEPAFVQGVRHLYAGFFLGEEQRFGHGVRQLGLGSAGQQLLAHLGDDDQRCVRFRSATLQPMLREISAARTNEARPLHRNFIAFGVYVASLHELLETLDLGFDVRSAFMRVHRRQLDSDV